MRGSLQAKCLQERDRLVRFIALFADLGGGGGGVWGGTWLRAALQTSLLSALSSGTAQADAARKARGSVWGQISRVEEGGV